MCLLNGSYIVSSFDLWYMYMEPAGKPIRIEANFGNILVIVAE